jgi:hypothetical protein
LKLSYTKSDDTLSVPDQVPLQPSQPIDASTSTLHLQEGLPYILGTLGVVLIIGGGLWFWVISRKRQAQGAHQRFNFADHLSDDEEAYCHQCGRRAEKDDVFCRTCGTRLRRE